jgi:hypothetical protein
MDTRTGELHEMRKGESKRELSERIGVPEKYLVPLGKAPEPDCPKCGGKGGVRAGVHSKRYKPCKCTYA